MNRSLRVIVLILLIVLTATLTGAFLTRGVMAYLPFLQAQKGSWTGAYVPLGIVDQRPWQEGSNPKLCPNSKNKETNPTGTA